MKVALGRIVLVIWCFTTKVVSGRSTSSSDSATEISSIDSYPSSSNLPICQHRNCPKGYKFSALRCECVEFKADPQSCLVECPRPYIANYVTCECEASPVPAPTERGCDPEPCPRGYAWELIDYTCGCWLTCDYIMSCPSGQKWDFIECSCVQDSSVSSSSPSSSTKYRSRFGGCIDSCPSGYIPNQEKCRCDPISSTYIPSPSYLPSSSPSCQPQSCPPGYSWGGYFKVGCGCILNCDYIGSCRYGQKWDLIACRCVDDPSASSSPSTSPSSCSWKNCPKGYKFDYARCDCFIFPEDPNICNLSCPSNSVANYDTCECDETSSPSPSCVPTSCPRGYIWGLWGQCSCVLACDYIMSCPSGQKWDFIECSCVNDFSASSLTSSDSSSSPSKGPTHKCKTATS